MTVYTVYMAAMVVCLVAILIVFELIDQPLSDIGKVIDADATGPGRASFSP